MTPERIAELRRLADAATKGPWTAKEPAFAPGIKARVFGPTYKGKFEGQETMAVPDAEFIAASREAVPALLADLDRVEAENAALKEQYDRLKRDHDSMDADYSRVVGLCEKSDDENYELRKENAALRARVAVLEEVRKAAEEVSYKYSDDYSEDNLRWNELIGALADADALDRANKENQ